MKKNQPAKKEYFREKYKVLEKFSDGAETSSYRLSEQYLKFLSEIYTIWRTHPSSNKEIIDSLNSKIKRQSVFYKLSQKGL